MSGDRPSLWRLFDMGLGSPDWTFARQRYEVADWWGRVRTTGRRWLRYLWWGYAPPPIGRIPEDPPVPRKVPTRLYDALSMARAHRYHVYGHDFAAREWMKDKDALRELSGRPMREWMHSSAGHNEVSRHATPSEGSEAADQNMNQAEAPHA